MIELETDPASATALFERAAPDLETPKGVVLEAGPPHDIARWSVRTGKSTWRMKVATEPAAKERLRWGVDVLRALAAAAPTVPLAVPVVERVHGHDGGVLETPLVVVETRLGTSDAATRWDRLTPSVRDALLDPLAKALGALHAVPAPSIPRRVAAPTRSAASGEGFVAKENVLPATRVAAPWRDAVRAGVAKRVGRLRAQGSLAADLLGRVEARLAAEVDAIPPDVQRRLCHGRVRPSSVALEADAFAGLRDFEEARVADPLTDAALWMLTTGDPAGKSSRRLLAAFLRDRASVPDLATRLDAYLGLETLRVVSEAADLDAPDAVDALAEALEQWLSGAWRVPT